VVTGAGALVVVAWVVVVVAGELVDVEATAASAVATDVW